MKQLGLTLLNFESTRKRLPAASDRTSGTHTAPVGGSYSWVALVLPFLEETNLYNTISGSTARFSSSISSVSVANQQTSLPQLVCPSFAEDKAAAVVSTIGTGTCGVTNYKAMAGVNYDSNRMPNSAVGSGSTGGGGGAITLQYWEPFRTGVAGPYAGVTLAQVSDGTSKTFALAETREKTAAAWIDGARSWVTAANGSATYSATAPNWTGTSSLLENKPSNQTPNWIGYTAATSSQYGPSSFHQGSIVMHCYVDGHVGQVTNEIDTNLYFSLSSRGDNEAIADAP